MPIRSFTFYITNPALLRCWISYNTWCALYVGNRSRGMLGPRRTLVEGPKKGQMRRGSEPAGMSRSFPSSSHIFCLNMLLLHTWYQASSAIIWNIRFCSSTLYSSWYSRDLTAVVPASRSECLAVSLPPLIPCSMLMLLLHIIHNQNNFTKKSKRFHQDIQKCLTVSQPHLIPFAHATATDMECYLTFVNTQWTKQPVWLRNSTDSAMECYH